jgi:predicted metal-dependent hydrolase
MYQIIRSKKRRKTIALQIQRDGGIVIRAPRGTKDEEIDQFFDEKKPWIRKKLEEIRHEQRAQRPREFISGEEFLFLGRRYPLRIATGEEDGDLTFDEDGFHLGDRFREQARDLFIQWYKDRAETVIRERTNLYRERLGVVPARERITSAKHQWGSCSPQNALTFSWRMVMAPISVIDYVVVHELAHLRERNHSPIFWKIVEQILPEYRKERGWLKRYGSSLRL